MKQHLGYKCPLCQATFSPFDVINLLDPLTGTFHCEICKTELVQKEEENVSHNSNLAFKR